MASNPVIAAGVTIVGVEELIKKLKELPEKLEKKLIRSSLRVAGNILLRRTKDECPIGVGTKNPGALKKSLKLRAPRRSRKNKGKIRLRIITNAEDNLFKGDTYYGGFVEFGHRIGKRPRAAAKRKFGDVRGIVPPNPFMKRAATAARGEVIAAFRSDLAGKIAALANEP